jgi:hypothetical protein
MRCAGTLVAPIQGAPTCPFFCNFQRKYAVHGFCKKIVHPAQRMHTLRSQLLATLGGKRLA